jgi:16S rRNA (uracil1498-N3)-methyltransferase
MSKFFVHPEHIKGDKAIITGQEAHHILDVMRLKKQDRITAFDGTGKLYEGKILDTTNKKVKVQIEHVLQDSQKTDLEITLAQGLPKKNKMDYIIEKCTELGIDLIMPTQTTRTIVKLDRVRFASRKLRWQKVAREAAKQCGRTTIPQVQGLSPWPTVLSALSDFDLKLLFSLVSLVSLGKQTQRLKDVLRTHNKAKRIILLIGPEGDFTPEEVRGALNAGCIAVSLGKNILKSDTAAISALAMINYELK